MGLMKTIWMDESAKLAVEFQQFLFSKGIETAPDYDGAESVLMHKVPEADSHWDTEWRWVESRVEAFRLKEQEARTLILTQLSSHSM